MGPGMMMVRGGGMVSTTPTGAVTTSFTIRDSAGTRVMRTVVDSGGVPVVRTMRDSAGTWVSQRDSSRGAVRDSTRAGAIAPDSVVASLMRRFGTVFDSTRGPLSMRPAVPPPTFRAVVTGGNLLTSGLASIRETLDAFAAGRLGTYQDAIAMTRTTGWR
jgi:hypothetical protein